MDEIVLTEKGNLVVKALQVNAIDRLENATLAKDIADLTGLTPGGVPGVLTSLSKKGLINKTDETPRKYFLSDAGIKFETPQ